MIKIEKGIPLTKKGGSGYQYPWDKMENGDSFYIEGDHVKRASILSTGRSYILYSENKKRKIVSRAEKQGYRFWMKSK